MSDLWMLLVEGCMNGSSYRLRRPGHNGIVIRLGTKSQARNKDGTVQLCETKEMTMDLLPLIQTTIEGEESGPRVESTMQLNDRMSAPGVRVRKRESRASLEKRVSRFLSRCIGMEASRGPDLL